MFSSRNGRFAVVALAAALAACGAKADGPLAATPATTASEAAAASAMRPDNWFHSWKFYVNNKSDVRIRQLVRKEACMDHIPQERLYEPGHEYTQDLETSHDPSCYLGDSSITFDYYTKTEVGWGAVEWNKPFLSDYTIKTVDQKKLCFSTQERGVGQLQLNIRRC